MDSITPHCVAVSINNAVFTADSDPPWLRVEHFIHAVHFPSDRPTNLPEFPDDAVMRCDAELRSSDASTPRVYLGTLLELTSDDLQFTTKRSLDLE